MHLWHLTPDAPRAPLYVSAGATVELRLGTYPIEPGQATWITWQVLHFAWFAPEFQDGEVLLPDGQVASVRRFIAQGQGYTVEDLRAMVEEQRKILRNIVSIHRRLQDRGPGDPAALHQCRGAVDRQRSGGEENRAWELFQSLQRDPGTIRPGGPHADVLLRVPYPWMSWNAPLPESGDPAGPDYCPYLDPARHRVQYEDTLSV